MELERLKNSLYDADVKYSQMKRIEDDSLYKGIQKGTTKELIQAKLDKKFRNTNDKLNEYLLGLDAPSRERLEIEAIKNTLERNIKETMGGKRVVDYSGMLKTLKDNPNYKSEAAKKAIEITEKMNKIHGLDHTLADAFKAPKDPKLQQGLSHNVAVRYLTMAANRAVQNTVKFLPFLQMGKTAASRHAIYNAVMSSSSARELGEKLSKAAMNKDIPVSEKIDIIEMAKAQFKFSNELDKAKADGIVKEAATKQENNVIKKGEAPGQHPGANFANESAPMAKDSQGLAFSPYKDDAQRVAQTNNDIILQNSAKGGAAEQGSKLEQAEAKQVVEKQASGSNIGGGVVANSNAHLGSGLVAGTLNSIDEDGNFSPERFAAGFLAGLAGGKAIATGLRKMTPKLYNQILGAAEKMPQMANGNPRLLGKLYSNGKDVSLNSFAGQKAVTANVGKLDQAKAMLEKGADEVEIWQKTGWFKDKDGAWKFEIGDSNARLNPEFQSGGRLGELLDHEELFKAYPELKDVTVIKIGGATPQDAAYSVKDVAQKEKRGIYNVTYNDKTATLIKHDLDNVESALKYTIGNKDKGAKHINIRHMKDESAEGYVTQNELLNVGKNMREYLAKYEEPFINKRNARIYEWQDERGVRFRLVASNKSGEGRGLPSGKSRNLSPITNDLRPAANDGLDPNGSLEEIITFYSDRNLKGRMKFENPKVKYDVNLSEWHKDSAHVTKNADGSPKAFYHGSLAKDITEFKSEFDNSGIGFWFADKDYAANHGEGNLYETFLRIKNPLDLREENAKYPFELMREMQRKGLSLEPYGKTSKEAKEFLKQNGYDGIVLDGDYKERPFVIAFDSAQIKHVKNDGNFSDSPNIYKSGKEGYYSPAKNEIGLRDIGDKSTLMHEVQHAIQEIEDFARGGDFNTVWSVAAKNIEKKI